jgi:hypothetical protein
MADQGQVIDVAVHVGTLGAVVLYFWRDVRAAIIGTGHLVTGRNGTAESRLALGLIHRDDPGHPRGLALKLTGLDDSLRSMTVIGWTMLIFGIVLYWADQNGAETLEARDWSLKHALIMGLWQAMALIPGTSRSGITITAARYLGFERHDAARLSMLMSIPTILASGVLLGAEVIATADAEAASERRHRGRHGLRRSARGADLHDAASAQRQLHALRDLPGDPWRDPAGDRLHLGVAQVAGAVLKGRILATGAIDPQVFGQNRVHIRGVDPQIGKALGPVRHHVIPAQLAHLIAGQNTVMDQPHGQRLHGAEAKGHDRADPERQIHDQRRRRITPSILTIRSCRVSTSGPPSS